MDSDTGVKIYIIIKSPCQQHIAAAIQRQGEAMIFARSTYAFCPYIITRSVEFRQKNIIRTCITGCSTYEIGSADSRVKIDRTSEIPCQQHITAAIQGKGAAVIKVRSTHPFCPYMITRSIEFSKVNIIITRTRQIGGIRTRVKIDRTIEKPCQQHITAAIQDKGEAIILIRSTHPFCPYTITRSVVFSKENISISGTRQIGGTRTRVKIGRTIEKPCQQHIAAAIQG